MGLKENIKAIRTSHGLTLEDVAKYIGVSRQTMSRYETGVITNIPSDKIEKMAQLFNTSPSNLMGWEKEAPAANKDDEQLVEMFSKLNKQDRDYILKFMRSLADSDSQKGE